MVTVGEVPARVSAIASMTNFAEVAPAGMVTVLSAGTARSGLLLLRVTMSGLEVSSVLRDTVPTATLSPALWLKAAGRHRERQGGCGRVDYGARAHCACEGGPCRTAQVYRKGGGGFAGGFGQHGHGNGLSSDARREGERAGSRGIILARR